MHVFIEQVICITYILYLQQHAIYRYIIILLMIVHMRYTSAKLIQLNEWGCRDGMHYAEICGNKEIPLAILSRILAQSCVTLYLNYVGRCYA